MDLRRLRYFVAVAEELHFRRAADRLFVTQPVVSEQVRKLEAEIELRLLSRDRRQVELTEAGAAFLTEARRVLGQAADLERTARGWRRGIGARLRLGVDPSLMSPAMPRALRQLRESLEDVRLGVRADSGRRLVEAVRRDRIDAALITLPAPADGLRIDEVATRRTAAILPGDSARIGPLELAELAAAPVLVFPDDGGNGFHSVLVGAFGRLGLAPELVESGAASVEAMALEVAATGLPAVVPGACADWLRRLDAQVLPIADAPPTRVALATRDGAALPQLPALLDALGGGEPAEPRPARRLLAA